MFLHKSTIVALLSMCAVTFAFAQRATEPDVVPSEKEIKSFEKAKLSLAEAIAVAAKKHKNATVVDVSFDSQGNQLAYKVKTYQDNSVWKALSTLGRGK